MAHRCRRSRHRPRTGSIAEEFRRARTGESGAASVAPVNPHNQIFAVAIQLGLIGVAVLLAMWAAHFMLFRGAGLVAWIGMIIVVQNVVSSLFNSHLFDFSQGWLTSSASASVAALCSTSGVAQRSKARYGKARGSRQDGRTMPALNMSPRRALIVAHDLLATAAAVVASFFIRFEGAGLVERGDGLLIFLPGFIVYAGIIYFLFHLYELKWRFASLPDLMNILRAATVLAVSLLVLDYILVAPNVLGQFFFGKITIALYWVLQMVFLGASRIAYRYFRYTRTRQQARAGDANPTLVLGRAADAEVLLRAIESGAVKKIWPVGILSPSRADQGQTIRGIPVLGDFDAPGSRGRRPCPARHRHLARDLHAVGVRAGREAGSDLDARAPARPHDHAAPFARRGRRDAAPCAGQCRGPAAAAEREDRLRRGSKISCRGKSVVVTGGGGSIGAEICDRVDRLRRRAAADDREFRAGAACRARNRSRPSSSQRTIDGRIADVRDRDRLFRLLADFKPDIVFHAAALKHVP